MNGAISELLPLLRPQPCAEPHARARGGADLADTLTCEGLSIPAEFLAPEEDLPAADPEIPPEAMAALKRFALAAPEDVIRRKLPGFEFSPLTRAAFGECVECFGVQGAAQALAWIRQNYSYLAAAAFAASAIYDIRRARLAAPPSAGPAPEGEGADTTETEGEIQHGIG